ncbi:hypothetical protein NX801_16885 [Streptomyces sp. LP05-1]|uniref:DUF7847 domain-containing protein n=1 Tax=Streptomyces pyxinae TaxID=2970734 RepID=A0ABT2CL70_9ACTN|nr:hypothetical protein [Streptomyces sp. LP05-1]MCS0637309.1 hypothetical protein [Streptomyces sp. LP05-1]
MSDPQGPGIPPGYGHPAPPPPPGAPGPSYPAAPGWGPGPGWSAPRPGVIPLAPLGLGDIFNGAFTTLGRHWRQLFGLALAAYAVAALAVVAVAGLAYLAVAGDIDRLVHWSHDRAPGVDEFLPPLIALVVVYLFGSLVLLIANAVVQAGCPAVLQDAVLGRPTTIGTVWRRVRRRLTSVLGAVLLTGLIVFVPVVLIIGTFTATLLITVITFHDGDATAAFAVLGLAVLALLVAGPLATWLWVKYSFAPAVAVFERSSALTAMSRSSRLVKGSWWRVFGISMLGYLAASVAAYLLQLPFSLAGGLFNQAPQQGADAPEVVAFVVIALVFGLGGQLLGQLLTSAFPQLVISLLYVDQRIRRENLAPTLMAAAAPAAPPAPQPPAPTGT